MKKTFSQAFLVDNNSIFEKIKNSLPLSLGPKGSSVMLFQNNSEIKFLSNGSSIINSFDFLAKEEQIFGKSLKYLAKKNQLNSGEGSLSVCLFFGHLIFFSRIFLISGHNPIALAKGFQKLSFFISNLIFQNSMAIRTKNDIKGILKSNLGEKMDRDMTLFLLNSFKNVKREAFIQIEENIFAQNEFSKIEGIEIEKGFLSPYFINDFSAFRVSYDNALLLISTSPLTEISQIQVLLDFSIKENLPLILITESISKDLLSILLLNYLKKKIKIAIIKYSSIQSLKTGLLEDLALMTQTNYLEREFLKGEVLKRSYKVIDLGLVHKVFIYKDKAQFVFSKFSKVMIKRRLNELNRELLLAETNYEKILYENRISRLSGNLLKIKISNEKHINIVDLKKKIENLALNLRSTLEEGYLSGGFSFYLFTSKQIQYWSSFNLIGEELYSSQILINSLEKFSFDFLKNIKNNRFIIFQNLLEISYPNTFDLINEEYVNGLKKKIFSSSKTIKFLFLHSLSLLSTLITMNCD